MGQDGSAATKLKLIVVGSIGAPSGIKGWVKINSYTDPLDNIFNFNQWFLADQNCSDQYISDTKDLEKIRVLEVKNGAKPNQLLALIAGVADRTAAACLTNKKIAVDRDELPELESAQYYWADLVGCLVYHNDQLLGRVQHMFNNNANDIMSVVDEANAEQHLIPFVMDQFVLDVDLSEQKILVNWS